MVLAFTTRKFSNAFQWIRNMGSQIFIIFIAKSIIIVVHVWTDVSLYLGSLSYFFTTLNAGVSTFLPFQNNSYFLDNWQKKTWSLDWNTFSGQLSSENPQTGKI